MNLKIYFRQKRRILAVAAVFAGVFLLCFWLYGLPVNAVVYPCLLCMVLGAVLMVKDFHKEQVKHRALEKITLENLGELPPAESQLEADYQERLETLGREMEQRQTQRELAYRDRLDYYTAWAHQIKTPIAAMQLKLQDEDTPLARQLRSDLLRIQQYADMVMVYLRLDSDHTDYVFKTYSIDSLVRRAVKEFASEFISRGIALKLPPLPGTVVTDDKWLAFVLEQLLSNALKYTRSGSITISMEEPGILSIRDTGMGIAPEDLPRIFQKGYTGFNGRQDYRASGLGLYLCKRVCDNLHIAISAASQVGQGTEIRLDLNQYNLTAE